MDNSRARLKVAAAASGSRKAVERGLRWASSPLKILANSMLVLLLTAPSAHGQTTFPLPWEDVFVPNLPIETLTRHDDNFEFSLPRFEVDGVRPLGFSLFTKEKSLTLSFDGFYIIDGEFYVAPDYPCYEPLFALDVDYDLILDAVNPPDHRKHEYHEIGEDVSDYVPPGGTCPEDPPGFSSHFHNEEVLFDFPSIDTLTEFQLSGLDPMSFKGYRVELATYLRPLHPGSTFDGTLEISVVAKMLLEIEKDDSYAPFFREASRGFYDLATLSKFHTVMSDSFGVLELDAAAVIGLMAYYNPDNQDIQNTDTFFDWVSLVRAKSAGDAADAVIDILTPFWEAQQELFQKLADDPPDPDFDTIFEFEPNSLQLNLGFDPATDDSISEMVSLQLDVLNIVTGILKSVERAQGAVVGGDPDAARRQIDALKALNLRFAERAPLAQQLFSNQLAILVGAGQANSFFDRAKLDAAFAEAAGGLSPASRAALESLGIPVTPQFESAMFAELAELQSRIDIAPADGTTVVELYTSMAEQLAGFVADISVNLVHPIESVVGLPDINSNGFAELVVVTPGIVRAQIRDGSDDTLISDVDFGSDPGVAAEVIPDINNNGAPEIAVLGQRPSGQIRVQIRDSLTGDFINSIFYGDQYVPVDLAVMPDTNSNNAPEIAVLGQNATGGIRVQARDALDDAETSTTFYGSNADPVDVQVLPDINGSGYPEIVVHSRITASGQTKAQIRDSETGQMIRQVFFGSAYAPVHLAIVNDVSGDGLPDLAQLGRRSDTGAVRVQIKASSGGPAISNAFLGATDVPVETIAVGDMNSSGSMDTATLVERPDGTGKVVLRDGLTGDFIGNIFFGAIDNPIGLTLVDDLDSSGNPELAALGQRNGIKRVQIRDSVSGSNINTVDFP